MVVSDLNVFEDAERVFGEYGCGAVERDEVRGDGVAIDSHEADREAGRLLAGEARLEESYNTLLFFAGAHEQNVRFALGVDGELVSGNDGNAAPGEEWRTEDGGRGRGNAATRAFASERRDGARMREEERGLLPDDGEQLVHVVRCGRAFACLDAGRLRRVVEQAVVGVVDEF